MPSGFLYGKMTPNPQSGGASNLWKQLSTSVYTVANPHVLLNLRVHLTAGANVNFQLDSDSAGTNTTFQSSIETGIPATGQWVDLGPIDPSRVWVRCTSTTTNTVYWMVTWP